MLVVFTVIDFSISGTRPDTIGMLFILLSVICAERTNFSAKGLWISTILSFIAFNFKQYYLLSFPIICLWLFLFRSKKRGILYGILGLTGMAGAMLLICQFFPLYLNCMVFHHLVEEIYDFSYMWYQLLLFMLLFWFGICGVFQAIPLAFQIKKTLKWSSFSSPLFNEVSSKESIYLFSFLIGLVCFMIKLGWSLGNLYTYFIDLVLPFLLISFFVYLPSLLNVPGFISRTGIGALIISAGMIVIISWLDIRRDLLTYAFVLIFLAVILFLARKADARLVTVLLMILSLSGIQWIERPYFITAEDLKFEKYAQLERSLDSCKEIYLSPIAYTWRMSHDTVRTSDNGEFQYFNTAIYHDDWPFAGIFHEQTALLTDKKQAWLDDIYSGIENQTYGCLLLTDLDFIKDFEVIDDYYEPVESFDLRYKTYLYRPKQP